MEAAGAAPPRVKKSAALSRVCIHCGATSTCFWRRADKGIKAYICNACGCKRRREKMKGESGTPTATAAVDPATAGAAPVPRLMARFPVMVPAAMVQQIQAQQPAGAAVPAAATLQQQDQPGWPVMMMPVLVSMAVDAAAAGACPVPTAMVRLHQGGAQHPLGGMMAQQQAPGTAPPNGGFAMVQMTAAMQQRRQQLLQQQQQRAMAAAAVAGAVQPRPEALAAASPAPLQGELTQEQQQAWLQNHMLATQQLRQQEVAAKQAVAQQMKNEPQVEGQGHTAAADWGPQQQQQLPKAADAKHDSLLRESMQPPPFEHGPPLGLPQPPASPAAAPLGFKRQRESNPQQQQQQQEGIAVTPSRAKRPPSGARKVSGSTSTSSQLGLAIELPGSQRVGRLASGGGRGRGAASRRATASSPEPELDLSIAAPLLALAAALDPGYMPQLSTGGAGSSSSSSEGAPGLAAATGQRSVTAELELLLAADSNVWSIARALQAGG